MRMKPHLNVLVANGYCDLAMRHFASDATCNYLNLDEVRMKDIAIGNYDTGRMTYIHEPSNNPKAKELRSPFWRSAACDDTLMLAQTSFGEHRPE
jgi:carboxypeptidase C (cathepsin A)